VNNGFLLATKLTPASASGPEGSPARREHDSKYLPYLTLASCHTEEPIKKIYGDKGYPAPWNRKSVMVIEILGALSGFCLRGNLGWKLFHGVRGNPTGRFWH